MYFFCKIIKLNLIFKINFQIEKRLKELKVHIPLQEAKLEQLSQQDKTMFDECNKYTEMLSIKEIQLKNLDSQINSMKEKLVSENEIEHILS